MYDELTEVDIRKMEEEIRYRRVELAPKLMAEMKRTREFGDLSENAESFIFSIIVRTVSRLDDTHVR